MKTRYLIFTFLFFLSASITYGQDTLEAVSYTHLTLPTKA